VSGTTRAVALGLLIGLLPMLVVFAATSGLTPADRGPADISSAASEPPAQLDPAYVDQQLALYAATPAARPSPNSAWTRGGLTAPRSAASIPTATLPAQPKEAPAPRIGAVAPAAAPVRPLVAGAPSIRSAPAPAPRSASALGAAVPPAIRRWESLIAPAAARAGIDPNLLAALIMTESAGNPDATSAKVAVGLMQIVGGPRDPAANVAQGAAILAEHLARYGRNDLALAAYNAGAGAVDQHGGVPPYRETRDLVFRVLVRYELYSR
jgi:soluble lytic murein transglycosylase-like protein